MCYIAIKAYAFFQYRTNKWESIFIVNVFLTSSVIMIASGVEMHNCERFSDFYRVQKGARPIYRLLLVGLLS